MAFLTRDQILSANDLDVVIVPVPEWGGDVRVRTMTGADRDRFETRFLGGKTDTRNLRAEMVAAVVVDDAGANLFRPADVESLGRKSARALNRVFDAAMKLNGLSAGDVEDLEKNSNTLHGEGISA